MFGPSSFFRLAMAGLSVAVESHAVIGLRLTSFALGTAAPGEVMRMHSEKVAALFEAQRVATDSAAPESEIPAATAAPADSPNGAPRSDARRLRAEGDLTLPEPDFGKLEATIAELEAAVSASGRPTTALKLP